MKKQNEIWIEHTKNLTVNAVLNGFNKPAIFQKELVQLIDEIAIQNNYKNVIELGCETGITSMLLSNTLNKTFLDLNPEAIDLAKKSCEELNISANFICGDMFSTNLQDKAFDIVFNAGVVEHFSSKDQILFLLEYKRILHDNGTMVIAFPNHFSFPYRSAYIIRNYLFMGYKWPFPKEFKIFDMKKELEASGLHIKNRKILSKSSIFGWWDFFRPFKLFLIFLDKFFNFEGYLTVLIIGKNQ